MLKVYRFVIKFVLVSMKSIMCLICIFVINIDSNDLVTVTLKLIFKNRSQRK